MYKISSKSETNLAINVFQDEKWVLVTLGPKESVITAKLSDQINNLAEHKLLRIKDHVPAESTIQESGKTAPSKVTKEAKKAELSPKLSLDMGTAEDAKA